MKLQHYLDFNASEKVKVIKINAHETFQGGICTYQDAHNSSFYLKEATITFVAQGSKYMLVDKREYHLCAGDLLYVPKNSVVFTEIHKGSIPFISFNIKLPSDKIESHPMVSDHSTLDLANEPFAIYQNSQIKLAFQFFMNSLRGTCKEDYHQLLKTLFFSIKPNLINSNDNHKKIVSGEMNFVPEMIVENLFENLSLDEMAEKCHVSLATFKRKFSTTFGTSPKLWSRNVRLQAAYFYLKTKSISVSHASQLTGFDNLPHFSYVFKKYFALPPSALLSDKLS